MSGLTTYIALPNALLFFLSLLVLLTVTYTIYCFALHPLACFPGPPIAALTNLWKFTATWKDHLPRSLFTYHADYNSSVIRIGPNSLHFNSAEAFLKIYKSGWSKSSFYDGFGAPGPRGLFNETDEAAHGVKRRMFMPAFSMGSLQEMEGIIDVRYGILRTQLDRLAESGEVFDLKHYISFCLSDALGELAFGRVLGAQEDEDIGKLPPVQEFLYMGGVKGSWPVPWLLGLIQCFPSEYVTKLLNSLSKIQHEAVEAIAARTARRDGRIDMLGKILSAQNNTGETPDEKLPVLSPDESAFQHRDVEAKLEFVNMAILESYRKDPGATFDMPRIVPEGDGEIDGNNIPGGTIVSANLYSLGRNPAIWGSDVNEFNPDRWYEHRNQSLQSIVAPFSIGKRSCVSEDFAHMNVLKMVTTLLRSYEFAFVNADEPMVTVNHGGDFLETPIMVRVRRRGQAFVWGV